MQKKKLLVLGGKPIASYDIVNYAKSEGVYTIVTDNLSSEVSPAKQIADEAWNISTADVDLLVEKVKKEGIDAVFTGVHEFNIRKSIELCKKTNLPFYTTEKQMEITSVKNIYKRLFKEYNVPVVPEYQIDERFDRDDLDKIVYPVILKPIDGSGGRGVLICNDESELKANFTSAMQYSFAKKILLEKYVRAKEVTIFYLLQDGNISLSAIADRHVANGSDSVIPLPVAYLFPSKHIDNYISNVNDNVIATFKSIGLKDGMIFIQAFIDEEKFMIYDIGFRLTGTQEYQILEEVCGYNPLKMMVDYALTRKMGKEDITKKIDPYFYGKYACNITYLCKPCKIGKIEGIEEIKNIRGVTSIVPNHLIGEVIPDSSIGTLNQVILRVFAVAENKEMLIDIIEQANCLVKVYSDKNEDVLLPVINTKEL